MISDAERSRLHIGFKQAVRALGADAAEKVFLAEDCDGYIKDEVISLASSHNAPVFYVSDMKELGSMCKIDVGASCAVILK